MFENVDRRTDRVIGRIMIAHLRAFGSAELIWDKLFPNLI